MLWENRQSNYDKYPKKLNMTPEQAIAFGDNYNDLDMLKLVGRGVIMQNAKKKKKKQMEYITKSNNEDGIYEYLQKLDLV